MTTAEGVTQWQYDIQGRVVCIDSPEGVLCYGYDERGRVVREEQNGRVTEREYPQARTMLRRILPPEGEGTTAQEATFRVNYAGELTECRLSDHVGTGAGIQRTGTGKPPEL